MKNQKFILIKEKSKLSWTIEIVEAISIRRTHKVKRVKAPVTDLRRADLKVGKDIADALTKAREAKSNAVEELRRAEDLKKWALGEIKKIAEEANEIASEAEEIVKEVVEFKDLLVNPESEGEEGGSEGEGSEGNSENFETEESSEGEAVEAKEFEENPLLAFKPSLSLYNMGGLAVMDGNSLDKRASEKFDGFYGEVWGRDYHTRNEKERREMEEHFEKLASKKGGEYYSEWKKLESRFNRFEEKIESIGKKLPLVKGLDIAKFYGDIHTLIEGECRKNTYCIVKLGEAKSLEGLKKINKGWDFFYEVVEKIEGEKI